MKKNNSLLILVLFLLGAFYLGLNFVSCKGSKDPPPVTTVFSASHVSIGKAAPGLSAYRIAYYEAVSGEAAGSAAGSIQESDEPFRIADYGPQGELPSEIKKPSIYVVFSQPVVPLARLGEAIREDASFFSIEPELLKGVYRW